ncbi:hypothetical protein [Leclercia pneumoniae]|nr:hypothetical protein [Leclercia pneumoniae]
MSSDTPIIDMAKMFTRLGDRLDCTTLALRWMLTAPPCFRVPNL